MGAVATRWGSTTHRMGACSMIDEAGTGAVSPCPRSLMPLVQRRRRKRFDGLLDQGSWAGQMAGYGGYTRTTACC